MPGASKFDNYQNFAKAFRVQDYAAVMTSIEPNAARLKSVTEFTPRDLTDRTELGPTPLGALVVVIQEFMATGLNWCHSEVRGSMIFNAASRMADLPIPTGPVSTTALNLNLLGDTTMNTIIKIAAATALVAASACRPSWRVLTGAAQDKEG